LGYSSKVIFQFFSLFTNIVVQRNDTLLSIDLSWNAVQDVGAEAMLSMLRSNVSLVKVNLFGNDISDLEVIKELRRVQGNNGEIRVLLAMRSAQLVVRLGKKSLLRIFPLGLLRQVCKMIVV
jgi:hypothetical protein